MSDDDTTAAHAYGFEIPVSALHALTGQHRAAVGHAQDRHNRMFGWLENLDTEGLLALRWILQCDADEAYANNARFDGMCILLLRAKGVDPATGEDPAEQLLLQETLREKAQSETD